MNISDLGKRWKNYLETKKIEAENQVYGLLEKIFGKANLEVVPVYTDQEIWAVEDVMRSLRGKREKEPKYS